MRAMFDGVWSVMPKIWLKTLRLRGYLIPPKPTFCRVPIKSILGFIIRAHKKAGFGRLGYTLDPQA